MVSTSSKTPHPGGWHASTPYQPGPDGYLRPYLFFEVRSADGSWQRTQGLIDSGADMSVLPLQWAVLLGLDVSALLHEQGQQVVGSMDVWRTQAPLRARVIGVEANEFDLMPVFIQAVQTPLLGRMDFMSYWGIQIDEKQQRLTLTVL